MSSRFSWRGFILALLMFTLFSSTVSVGAQADPNWLLSPIPDGKKCTKAAPWGEPNPAGRQDFHNAWDFCNGAKRGSPIVAVADGIVVYADWWQKDYQNLNLGHGWTVGVWHARNKIYTYYTHLQEFKVSVGQEVKKGDIVGLEGDSGKTNGFVHTHFVTAIMEPQRMVTPKNCPQPYCFPNPDEFLGKDTVAQDLGLTTISPTGEVFKPAAGMPIYSGGKDDILDLSYMSFVETAMSTTIPAVIPQQVTEPIISDFNFEEMIVDENSEQENPPEIQAQTTPGSPVSKWGQPLKWLLFGLSVFFLLGMVFSENFRKGAVWVLLITVLVVLVGLLILSFLP